MPSLFHQFNRFAQFGFTSFYVQHRRAKARVAAKYLDDTRVNALVCQSRHKLPSTAVAAGTCDARCGVERGKQVQDLRCKAAALAAERSEGLSTTPYRSSQLKSPSFLGNKAKEINA